MFQSLLNPPNLEIVCVCMCKTYFFSMRSLIVKDALTLAGEHRGGVEAGLEMAENYISSWKAYSGLGFTTC